MFRSFLKSIRTMFMEMFIIVLVMMGIALTMYSGYAMTPTAHQADK